jgi:predicted PurR-regulated permease PerM
MDEKRAVVALFGVAVAAVITYVAYRFVAALTVAVFLYYSTRGFYKRLARLRLPKRIRAVTAISVLALPLILLVSYTVVLLVTELQTFINQSALIETTASNVSWLQGLEDPPELSPSGLYEAYQNGRFDAIIGFLSDNASFLTSAISGFFLNLLIVIIITYYLLIDGSKIHAWLLRFDDDAIVREFLEDADAELEAVLFGNLLNVIAISIIAIASYLAYNSVVPAAVEVPYPALAGALTGIASLIPVVGMKIVYVPLAAMTALPTILGGDPSMLVYTAGFLVVALVVVDTIPDLVLRPFLSGEKTHVGLLMLAYILGPVVFGFYGLFFAPILLVLGLTFADTALPRLLGAKPQDDGLPDGQTALDEFRT